MLKTKLFKNLRKCVMKILNKKKENKKKKIKIKIKTRIKIRIKKMKTNC